jgi:hypothetical protein
MVIPAGWACSSPGVGMLVWQTNSAHLAGFPNERAKMPEVIGWWGDEPVYGELPPPLDPTPFAPEGRRLQRLEHELRLEQARLNVDRLQARKRELERTLRRARTPR